MRIKILGFKCHIEAEFIFVNHEMTLIKGNSGCGKSSLLSAIFWALYGNMRSIYNNLRITKNLSVTLELSGITIHRKKNPELLTVITQIKEGQQQHQQQHQQGIYEDTVAQSLIDSMFGSREVWKACSYIEQQSRCSLLSGSGSERLELLNALSFTGDTPKEYINKIGEKLKEVTHLFNTNQATFNTEVNLYTVELNEKIVTCTLDYESLNTLKQQILQLESNEKKSYEDICNFERQQGTLTYLKDSLIKLEKKLATILSSQILPPNILTLVEEREVIIPDNLYTCEISPEVNDTPLLTFEKYSSNKTNFTKQLNDINLLIFNIDKCSKELIKAEEILLEAQNKIISIPNIENLINIPVKQEEIWNVNKIEKEREKFIQDAKSLGIEYTQEAFQDLLTSLTNTLSIYNNFEKQLHNYSKLISIEKDITKLRNLLDKYLETKSLGTNENLKSLEVLSNEKSLLIADLKKGLELLNCPSCNVPLRYQKGTLTIGERNPVSQNEILSAEEEYRNILSIINNLRQLINLEENAKMYNISERDKLEEYIKNGYSSKIPILTSKIAKISNIKYISSPTLSSLVLTDIYNFQKAYHNKNNIDTNKDISTVKTLGTLGTLEKLESEKVLLNISLKENEDLYKVEQERIRKNQDIIRDYQKRESIRLKEISRLESEKRNQQEKKNRIQLENEQKIKKYENDKRIFDEQKTQIENEILGKKEEIANLEKQMDQFVKDRYNQIKKDLLEKKKFLDDSLYGNKMVEKGKELQEKRNKLIELQKDVEILTRLKLKASEVECKQLEDTVENINLILETTLPIFFNEPISLKLLLYKKVKKTVKPMLNLEICYKGCKYDNINNLSGGEGDRISLALLLALNTVSNSPILLLDECVASLDAELKESCLTAIKAIPNKTVICVDHDDSLEGFYDSVVSL